MNATTTASTTYTIHPDTTVPGRCYVVQHNATGGDVVVSNVRNEAAAKRRVARLLAGADDAAPVTPALPAILDTVPCHRCGGTGTFIAHPHQQTGTVCFRCGGTRIEKLSKKMAAIAASLPTIDDARVGDQTYIGVNLMIVTACDWLAPDATIKVASPFGPMDTPVNVVKRLTRVHDGAARQVMFVATTRVEVARAEYDARMRDGSFYDAYPTVRSWCAHGDVMTGSVFVDTTDRVGHPVNDADVAAYDLRTAR